MRSSPLATLDYATLGWIAAGGTAIGLAAAVGLQLRTLYRHYFGAPPGYCFNTAGLDDPHASQLGHYYVHAGGKNAEAIEAGLYCNPPLDAQGIPQVDYGGAVGKRVNPYTVALYAIENWEASLSANGGNRKELFWKMADWLVCNHDAGRWYYRFDLDVPRRGLRDPWISAICQGKGMSVMLRAWQQSEKSEYRDAAEAALHWFQTPLEQGGIASHDRGGTWFEEYPNAAVPSHVLNGHLWSLFGLWDYWRATAHDAARRLFDEGIAVVETHLERFDTGYWVRYELLPDTALVNSAYMHFQIEQLRVLAAITGKKRLGEVADRWAAYHRSPASYCKLVRRSFCRRFRRLIGTQA